MANRGPLTGYVRHPVLDEFLKELFRRKNPHVDPSEQQEKSWRSNPQLSNFIYALNKNTAAIRDLSGLQRELLPAGRLAEIRKILKETSHLANTGIFFHDDDLCSLAVEHFVIWALMVDKGQYPLSQRHAFCVFRSVIESLMLKGFDRVSLLQKELSLVIALYLFRFGTSEYMSVHDLEFIFEAIHLCLAIYDDWVPVAGSAGYEVKASWEEAIDSLYCNGFMFFADKFKGGYFLKAFESGLSEEQRQRMVSLLKPVARAFFKNKNCLFPSDAWNWLKNTVQNDTTGQWGMLSSALHFRGLDELSEMLLPPEGQPMAPADLGSGNPIAFIALVPGFETPDEKAALEALLQLKAAVELYETAHFDQGMDLIPE
jgi:hypothetical protein